MSTSLRVLIVEDSEDDALLTVRELRRAGLRRSFRTRRDRRGYDGGFESAEWDLVIADYCLPQFSGMAALALLTSTGSTFPSLSFRAALAMTWRWK